MNKDFRVNVALFSHPKTVKLMRRMGDRAFYCLMRLWGWTAQHRPDGELRGMDQEDIEIAADWQGGPGELVKCLCEVGLLDQCAEGVYLVHDWHEHNGYASDACARSEQARKAAKAKWDKRLGRSSNAQAAKSDMPEQCPSNAEAEHQDCPSYAPSPSPSPSPSQENTLSASPTPVESDHPVAAPAGAERAEVYLTRKKRKLTGKRLSSFERFWSAYGYPKGKAEAADAWLDIPKLTDALVAQIVAAAEHEARQRPALIESGRTPKMAQGWLSGRRWEDADMLPASSPSPTQPALSLEEALAMCPKKKPIPLRAAQ